MNQTGSTGSESEAVDSEDGKKAKVFEPFDDNFLSDDEAKNEDVELCTIVAKDENGKEVQSK